MQFSNARPNSQGFTLIEVLIILLIISSLSAISAPTFLGLLNRSKVNNAVAQVQGALQEAHRGAIRRSRTCGVALTPGNQPKLTSNCFDITDYIIKASADKASGDTTVDVAELPVAISNGTGLVFSSGATGVVTQDAAKGSTSLTLSSGLSAAITSGEIVAFRTLPNYVAMATNMSGSPIQIQFGFRGNSTFITASAGTGNIILYQSNGSASGRKCVAISKGIGILRSGSYPDINPITPPTSITTNCKQSE
jgi:prepilin-type N-terminal cleavage/methylation domain-containing protein